MQYWCNECQNYRDYSVCIRCQPHPKAARVNSSIMPPPGAPCRRGHRTSPSTQSRSRLTSHDYRVTSHRGTTPPHAVSSQETLWEMEMAQTCDETAQEARLG